MNEEAQTKEPQKTALTEAQLHYWAGWGLLRDTDGENADERGRLGATLIVQAAEMGFAKAKVDAAQLYICGVVGGAPDREKGIALLREAVADGCDGADYMLALALRKPRYTSNAEVLWEGATVLWRERADYQAAHLLMSRAARMNHVPAMRDYAQMLREGIGCEKDTKLAAEIEWQADEFSKDHNLQK